MASPLSLTFRGANNEDFGVAQAFPWIANQWPLPAGSWFDSQWRVSPNDVDPVLSFSSLDGSLIVNWDAGTGQVVLTWSQPRSAMLALAGTYLLDVRVLRPFAVNQPPRVDQIGAGVVIITQGATRP